MLVNSVIKSELIKMVKDLKPSLTDPEFDRFCYIFSLGCALYEQNEELQKGNKK